MKTIVLKGLALFLLIMVFGCDNDEKKLIEQGDELVIKIEQYISENGHLPNSLESLGIKETMEGPLHYVKQDSLNYIVLFGTTLGESLIYYSDTKEWEDRFRGMGEDRM